MSTKYEQTFPWQPKMSLGLQKVPPSSYNEQAIFYINSITYIRGKKKKKKTLEFFTIPITISLSFSCPLPLNFAFETIPR